NDISQRSGETSSRFEEQMKGFQAGTGAILSDIAAAAEKFDVQGKALGAAAEQIDASNRRTEEVLTDRREALDSVVNQVDSKVGDLDQRLKRFSALLAETFEAAEGRDVARNGGYARRTAQGHPRAAAGDRGERSADAPGDRRADRRARRAQPYRGPPWRRHGRAAGPPCRADGGKRRPRRTAPRAR